MKANEIENGAVLMIGDLVIGCIETDIIGEATYKIPCKVTDIHHCRDVICEPLKSFPDELDWQEGDDFSWIEAIPLTAEMLEKNGWYIPLLKSWWEHPDIAFWMKQYTDGTFELMIDEDSDISFCTIRFVHELQRALRCCGLFDKANDIVV